MEANGPSASEGRLRSPAGAYTSVQSPAGVKYLQAIVKYIYYIIIFKRSYFGGGPPPQKKSEIGLFLPDLEISRLGQERQVAFSGATSYIRQSYSRS